MFDVIRDFKYISGEIIIKSIVNIRARDCSEHPSNRSLITTHVKKLMTK